MAKVGKKRTLTMQVLKVRPFWRAIGGRPPRFDTSGSLLAKLALLKRLPVCVPVLLLAEHNHGKQQRN